MNSASLFFAHTGGISPGVESPSEPRTLRLVCVCCGNDMVPGGERPPAMGAPHCCAWCHYNLSPAGATDGGTEAARPGNIFEKGRW
jgi:hypothetical protein